MMLITARDKVAAIYFGIESRAGGHTGPRYPKLIRPAHHSTAPYAADILEARLSRLIPTLSPVDLARETRNYRV